MRSSIRASTATDSRLVDHLLLDHETDVTLDLSPRLRERPLGGAGRTAFLGIDEPHGAAAEREGQRDLTADPSGAEHRDGFAHAGSLP